MKSSRCDSGHCVEVRVEPEDVYLWDSKEPKVRLRFTPDEWEAFLHGAKLGEFDVPEQVTEDSSLEHDS